MQLHSKCFLLFLSTFLSVIAVGCSIANFAVTPTALPPPQLLIVTSTIAPSMTPMEPPNSTAPAIETQPPSPTLDYSTPASPSSEWTTYTNSETGVTFEYPANWFFSIGDIGNGTIKAFVSNAPPSSVVSVKGYATELLKLNIDVKPTEIEGYSSLADYIAKTVLDSLLPQQLVSAEELPVLPQGYAGFRLIILGYGKSLTLYVEHDKKVISMSTLYVPGAEVKYLDVMEQIAGTITIP